MPKKQSLADKIAALNNVGPGNPSDWDGDGTSAVMDSNFEYETEINDSTSAIRKNMGIDLGEEDKKYSGQRVTRASLNTFSSGDEDDSDDDDDDSEADDNNKDDSESDKNEDSNDDDDDEESDDDDQGETTLKTNKKNKSMKSKSPIVVADDDDDDDEDDEDDASDSEASFQGFADEQGEEAEDAYTMMKNLNEMEEEDDSILIKKSDITEEVKRGTEAKKQMGLWDDLLGLRIKLQAPVTSSHQMPQGEYFQAVVKDENLKTKISSTRQNIATVLIGLLELQKDLLSISLGSDFDDSSKKRKFPQGDSDCESIWNYIKKTDKCFSPYKEEIIDKWNNKVLLTDTKINLNKQLKAVNQSVLKQVNAVMADKDRLLERSQVKRSKFEIIGKKPTEDNKDSNIYDDSDFYHHVLRELIANKTQFSDGDDPVEMGRQWLQIHDLKSKSKVKNLVDQRASKGRKVRYAVHEKLVNFMFPMTPVDASESQTRDKLIKHLFE